MNYYTKQIMSILDCNQAFAKLVQDQMECSGFDFSEATNLQFKSGILDAQIDLGLQENRFRRPK